MNELQQDATDTSMGVLDASAVRAFHDRLDTPATTGDPPPGMPPPTRSSFERWLMEITWAPSIKPPDEPNPDEPNCGDQRDG